LRAIPVHEVERVGNRPFDLTLRPVKPRPYERNPPTHWRPAQAIPNRKATKAAAALALMRRIIAQEAASSESANWPIGLHSAEENANLLKHPRLDHPEPVTRGASGRLFRCRAG
jgi:hypothetical protein